MSEEDEKALYIPDELLSIPDFEEFIKKFDSSRVCHVMNDIH